MVFASVSSIIVKVIQIVPFNTFVEPKIFANLFLILVTICNVTLMKNVWMEGVLIFVKGFTALSKLNVEMVYATPSILFVLLIACVLKEKFATRPNVLILV